jgi:hypothetical protein
MRIRRPTRPELRQSGRNVHFPAGGLKGVNTERKIRVLAYNPERMMPSHPRG